MINGKRIMVVDDDPDHLLICALVFERRGYKVLPIAGCKEEIELSGAVAEFRPDLIFMDHNMPGICGSDLTKMLKADPASRHIPVIYFTSESDIARLAKEAGADDHFSKPFEIKALIEIAHKFVA